MTDWPAWATERVAVLPADPAWQRRGAEEVVALERALGPWLVARAEHVGSTSVPGLPAKPIIDLQAAVADLGTVDEPGGGIATVLATAGWHAVPPELDGRAYRRFFVRVQDGRRAAHLHVMTPGTARWREQLAFRDALRADSGLVAAYAELKAGLAERHADDREAYTRGKADFVNGVLGR